jgi:hypothetical protein
MYAALAILTIARSGGKREFRVRTDHQSCFTDKVLLKTARRNV